MSGKARFRLADLFVVLICLIGAAMSLNMFRSDLFNTIDLQNEQAAGTIVIKKNIVQRRLAGRVLWDRLAVESPVYSGDLIRVARLSSATLNIDDRQIDLYENTLIRIQQRPGGEGFVDIELSEGSLGVSTGTGQGNLVLNMMGRKVELSPGTVANASANKEGMSLQVSKGSALLIDEEQTREAISGTMIVLDASGAERREPAAVITSPPPNLRYLKNPAQPLSVSFAWNRLYLEQGQLLRMEIAGDRNFSKIIRAISGLYDTAETSFDAGIWYWRLCLGSAVLSVGQIIVTDAAGPALISPVADSLYLYNNELPLVRFQWAEIEEVSFYILEVSSTPDFANLKINRQTGATFFVDSGLEQGDWYWRVMPVFPVVFEGNASYSHVSSFRVDKSVDSVVSAIRMPEPKPEPVPEPEPIPEPVPVEIRLLAPARGARLAGLTALREQTIFSWETNGEVVQSRFVLSRNSNPLRGRPAVEIANPGRSVRLNRLEEGVWYWTVEAKAANGLISSAEPRQLQVSAIPLLGEPLNRLPPKDHQIGIAELKIQTNIVFTWSAVSGANAYIFTLYERTAGGQRQITRTVLDNRTSWTLDNIGVLDRGIFVWQVEAVNRNRSGTIEQRGRVGENSFVIDVPRPGPVQLLEPGVLYGR